MKTTLTRESPSKVRLAVEATPEEVGPALDRAVKGLASKVKVPGFRPGKVPRQVLENRLGTDAIREATLQEAIPELLAKAVEGETLMPVAPPSVEVTTYELGSDLSFEATVEVRPEIELPGFDLLSVTRPSTKATPEEVEEQLERLRDRFATLETVARPARTGDFVLADVHGTIHGQEIKELSGTDQLYEVGSAWPVEELDREIDGKRAGDILQFNATLPEQVGGEHAGKEVTFRVLAKEVREKKLPALDDELARSASEFDTLDELRADLVERIEKVKGVQADAEVRNQVLEQILDDVEVEPPESLVTEEMAFRLRRLEQQLQAAGMTIEQYMQSQGFTEEQVESDLRRQAERNVRAQLILEEIGRREEFKVEEEELRAEVRYHAEAMRTDPAELAKQLGDRGRLLTLAGDIIRRKALNFLVEKAAIKEEQGKEAGIEEGASQGEDSEQGTTESPTPSESGEAGE